MSFNTQDFLKHQASKRKETEDINSSKVDECENCGTIFTKTHGNQIYCPECRARGKKAPAPAKKKKTSRPSGFTLINETKPTKPKQVVPQKKKEAVKLPTITGSVKVSYDVEIPDVGEQQSPWEPFIRQFMDSDHRSCCMEFDNPKKAQNKRNQAKKVYERLKLPIEATQRKNKLYIYKTEKAPRGQGPMELIRNQP